MAANWPQIWHSAKNGTFLAIFGHFDYVCMLESLCHPLHFVLHPKLHIFSILKGSKSSTLSRVRRFYEKLRKRLQNLAIFQQNSVLLLQGCHNWRKDWLKISLWTLPTPKDIICVKFVKTMHARSSEISNFKEFWSENERFGLFLRWKYAQWCLLPISSHSPPLIT